MARISSSVGLISGINTADIIDQLMSIESQQTNLIQNRINSVNTQKAAYTDLTTDLTTLQTTSTTLNKTSTFQNSATSSSDESVMTATAAPGAAVGSYQFQVARLVTTQQTVSRGFTDFDSTPVGAGNITIEEGGGGLASETNLNDLNGGAGVRRSTFRITDGSGSSATIDIGAAVTLDDVVQKINTALDVSVKASVDGDHLVLTDLSGKTTSDLSVQDLGGGHAATDLGLAGTADPSTPTQLVGTDVNYLSRNTLLTTINDGRGIAHAATGNDLNFALSDGSSFQVAMGPAKTIGDVIDAINNATGNAGKLTADIAPGGNGIRLTDTTGSTGPTVTDVGTSTAGETLGLIGGAAPAAGVLDGSPVIAGLDTVLLSSLNGGKGITLGSITVHDRSGNADTIDLSSAKTVQDVLTAITSATGGNLTGQLNGSGNGIEIADETPGAAGNLVVDDSATAQALGLVGTFGTGVADQGKNLQLQWVTANTQLADLNGGKGINPGSIKVSSAAGQVQTIDLSHATTLGDVIADVNARAMGVTASINANGDGLLLTDTSGGAGQLSVADVNGTTATDLNIASTAAAGTTTVDGSYEKTIAITATDTLATLQTKINGLNFGVNATIINDGTANAPYRLSLTSKNSGSAGQVVFDAGTTSLQTSNLVQAQDAAVFLGSGGSSAQPLLITASQNQLSGIIQGVTINLNGVSDKPVTLNITRDADNVVDQITQFTTGFNSLITKINGYTAWNSDSDTGGVLLGDSTTQEVEGHVYTMLNTVVPDGGKYRVLADIGITLGDGATLSFDEDKFRAAYADDPDAVTKLFTAATTATDPVTGKTTTTPKGVAGVIAQTVGQLTDPITGILPQENQTLDNKIQQFQDNITNLNSILDDKRNRLEEQFANMETVLAGLQSQQSALSSLTNSSSSSSTKK